MTTQLTAVPLLLATILTSPCHAQGNGAPETQDKSKRIVSDAIVVAVLFDNKEDPGNDEVRFTLYFDEKHADELTDLVRQHDAIMMEAIRHNQNPPPRTDDKAAFEAAAFKYVFEADQFNERLAQNTNELRQKLAAACQSTEPRIADPALVFWKPTSLATRPRVGVGIVAWLPRVDDEPKPIDFYFSPDMPQGERLRDVAYRYVKQVEAEIRHNDNPPNPADAKAIEEFEQTAQRGKKAIVESEQQLREAFLAALENGIADP